MRCGWSARAPEAAPISGLGPQAGGELGESGGRYV